MSYYIGIDPGMTTGAYAIMRSRIETKHAPVCDNAPLIGEGKKRILDFSAYSDILEKQRRKGIELVGVELVHSMPKQGITSAFKFGGGYYGTIALLAALKIPYVLVSPQEWKKYYKIKSGSTKEVSRQIAKELFPKVNLDLKKDSDKAEALLICNYIKRRHLGRL